MSNKKCILIGAPIDSGKTRQGCVMGPDAYRVAGISAALESLGHLVDDRGNLAPAKVEIPAELPPHLHLPAETIGWTMSLIQAAENAMEDGLPVFLGGDHSMSLGTVAGVARHAARVNRPQFVLWLDAHSDFHTPQSTASGNLHGTPLGYVTGREGFHGFPDVTQPIPQENICILGKTVLL